MKSYKDFLASVIEEQEQETVVESHEPEILSLDDFPILMGEEQNHHEPMDPPSVLIMRRKSVRQYPNGQRVALYFVDKINKYVTVPYTAMQWSSSGGTTTANESFTDEDKLKESIEHLDENIQKKVFDVYNNLNESNKQKFLDLAENDLRKLLDFVKKNK